jgi:nucleotide-binding universal stress UspA family protein
MNIKTVICAVDGGEPAHHAARQAFDAFRDDVQFVGVSVIPTEFGDMLEGHAGPTSDQNPMTLMRQTYQQILQRLEMEAQDAGIYFRSNLEAGQPFDRILDVAHAEDADLIVLGVQERGVVARRTIGGVAERVIGYAPCDVLLVPQDANLDFSSLLLATDGSEHSLRAERLAADLASDRNSKLTVLASADLPEHAHEHQWGVMLSNQAEKQAWETTRASAARLEEQGVQCTAEARTERAAVSIAQSAKEHDAGLVIMGSHGRTGLKRLLMGSVASRVLETSPCAVLVAR